MSGAIQGTATLVGSTIDPMTGNVIVSVTIAGTGNVSHLGRVTVSGSHDTVILASTGYTTSLVVNGQATITAANGDQLSLTYSGSGTVTPNGFDDGFTYQITGGTGRFAGATGGGTILSSDQTPISPVEIPFVFDLDGIISSVGSSKGKK
jgi:hypothetical protein